jgi:DNA-binding transcriptional MerR regulator
MERLKINQVAQELGVTPAGVYKRLKTDSQLFENHIVRERNTTYLTRDGIEVLRGLMQKAVTVEDSTGCEPVENQTVKYLQELVTNQQKTIDNLIASQNEQRQRTDTIIMKLTHDLEATRKSALAIEAKVDALAKKPEDEKIEEILSKPVPEVRTWEPAPKKQPQLSALKKIWYELINPAMLRAI